MLSIRLDASVEVFFTPQNHAIPKSKGPNFHLANHNTKKFNILIIPQSVEAVQNGIWLLEAFSKKLRWILWRENDYSTAEALALLLATYVLASNFASLQFPCAHPSLRHPAGRWATHEKRRLWEARRYAVHSEKTNESKLEDY